VNNHTDGLLMRNVLPMTEQSEFEIDEPLSLHQQNFNA